MSQELLQLISQLKQRHGDPLYGLNLGNTFYVFRPLQADEYSALVQMDLTDSEAICEASVVWPEGIDWQRVPAADPDHLANHIKDLSGFGDKSLPFFMLENFRAQMSGWKAQAETLISVAFPNKDFDEIRAMPMEPFLLYLSRAEWILKNVKGMVLEVSLEDPREEKPPVDSVEQVQSLREQGIDPMMTLYVPKRRDANWVGEPFIVGVDRWRTYRSAKEAGE